MYKMSASASRHQHYNPRKMKLSTPYWHPSQRPSKHLKASKRMSITRKSVLSTLTVVLYPTQLLHHGTPLSPAIVLIITWKPSQPLQSIHYRTPTLQQTNMTQNSPFTQSRYNVTKIMVYKPSIKPSKVSSSHLL